MEEPSYLTLGYWDEEAIVEILEGISRIAGIVQESGIGARNECRLRLDTECMKNEDSVTLLEQAR